MRGKILITGGAGTLGRAIVSAAEKEGWDCTFTIYSRDVYKQFSMRREHPACRYLLGDIRDPELYKTLAGHDLIIHAAAQKHIPESEKQPKETYSINVGGSENVLRAAALSGVPEVVLVSTDKVCHPVNTYGATKLLMERLAQEFSLSAYGQGVKVHLLRYGNVLGSNGSVLEVWRRQWGNGSGALALTDPNMTRFWLTERQAVALIERALDELPGTVLVPKLKACSMRELAQALYPQAHHDVIGLRPGEKMHEELLTVEETPYVQEYADSYRLYPVAMPHLGGLKAPYTSDTCPRLTADEIRELAAA